MTGPNWVEYMQASAWFRATRSRSETEDWERAIDNADANADHAEAEGHDNASDLRAKYERLQEEVIQQWRDRDREDGGRRPLRQVELAQAQAWLEWTDRTTWDKWTKSHALALSDEQQETEDKLLNLWHKDADAGARIVPPLAQMVEQLRSSVDGGQVANDADWQVVAEHVQAQIAAAAQASRRGLVDDLTEFRSAVSSEYSNRQRRVQQAEEWLRDQDRGRHHSFVQSRGFADTVGDEYADNRRLVQEYIDATGDPPREPATYEQLVQQAEAARGREAQAEAARAEMLASTTRLQGLRDRVRSLAGRGTAPHAVRQREDTTGRDDGHGWTR